MIVNLKSANLCAIQNSYRLLISSNDAHRCVKLRQTLVTNMYSTVCKKIHCLFLAAGNFTTSRKIVNFDTIKVYKAFGMILDFCLSSLVCLDAQDAVVLLYLHTIYVLIPYAMR